jgi:sigma-E factor negative regulatory protein RseA
MEPMDTNKKNRELISSLMDDALPDGDLELALAALDAPGGDQAWAVYHRIGDILRAEAGPEPSPEFSARLAARLAEEPLPPAPGAPMPGAPAPQGRDSPAVEAGPR